MRFDFACPDGSFEGTASPAMELTVSAAGYEPRKVALFDELGLPAFARRLAGTTPEKVVEELSNSKTFDALRKSMGRLDLVVKLQPIKR